MNVAPGAEEKDEEDGRNRIDKRAKNVERADVTLNAVDQETSFFIVHRLVLVGAHFGAQIEVDVTHFVDVHVRYDDALLRNDGKVILIFYYLSFLFQPER